MSVSNYNELKAHVGHQIKCITYGFGDNVALECMTCNETLIDFEQDAYDKVTAKIPRSQSKKKRYAINMNVAEEILIASIKEQDADVVADVFGYMFDCNVELDCDNGQFICDKLVVFYEYKDKEEENNG